MIVCHCYCVSDREIRKCAREGAQDLADVGRACGAGSGCGGCRPEVAQVLDAELRAQGGPVRLSVVRESTLPAASKIREAV